MKQTSVSPSCPAISTRLSGEDKCTPVSPLGLSPEMPLRCKGPGELRSTCATVPEVVVKSTLLFPRVPRDLYRPPLPPLEPAFVSGCLSWRCLPPLDLALDAREACGGLAELKPGPASAIKRVCFRCCENLKCFGGRNAASVVCVAEAFRVGLVGRSLRI